MDTASVVTMDQNIAHPDYFPPLHLALFAVIPLQRAVGAWLQSVLHSGARPSRVLVVVSRDDELLP